MPDSERVARGKRMKEARLKAAVRTGDSLSQAAMADLVSKELGRSLYQTQWSTYELGTSDPPLDVIKAAARVSELSPAYLAFGSTDTEELITPERARALTPEELDRAEKQAAIDDATQAQRGAGKAGRKRPA